jgi:D-3-phosphoglycerate dehydrogenase
LIKADPRYLVSTGSVQKLSYADSLKVEVLIIRSRTLVTRDLLTQFKNLKWIISCTAGFDHIDFTATSEFPNLQICHTPSAHTQSAAELTWALLLACVRKLPQAISATQKGHWDRQPLVGSELAGKTLGIVGLGRIGLKVAEIAHAFGMQIIAFDPYQDQERFEMAKATRLSFQELIMTADVLTFHVPSSKETKKMLRISHLEDLARGVILINTSRGDVIDPILIHEGLQSGSILAIGLDVHHKEPLPLDTPYLTHPRCISTPHIGAQTQEALKKVSLEALLKLEQISRGQSVGDTLPPKALWFTSPMGFVDG